MPIYHYKCSKCSAEEDVLQKMNDDDKTKCSKCDADALQKQVTSGSFILKGSGWYKRGHS